MLMLGATIPESTVREAHYNEAIFYTLLLESTKQEPYQLSLYQNQPCDEAPYKEADLYIKKTF